jgi:hypothetical protein
VLGRERRGTPFCRSRKPVSVCAAAGAVPARHWAMSCPGPNRTRWWPGCCASCGPSHTRPTRSARSRRCARRGRRSSSRNTRLPAHPCPDRAVHRCRVDRGQHPPEGRQVRDRTR